MGFVKGKKVTVLQNAPLKDPIKYKIMDYEVSLRQSEASMIEVITPEEAQEMTEVLFCLTIQTKKCFCIPLPISRNEPLMLHW